MNLMGGGDYPARRVKFGIENWLMTKRLCAFPPPLLLCSKVYPTSIILLFLKKKMNKKIRVLLHPFASITVFIPLAVGIKASRN